MSTRCDGELGWPVDDEERDLRAEIVADLEEIRDEVTPDWSPKRGAYNMAILVAKGFFIKNKRKVK